MATKPKQTTAPKEVADEHVDVMELEPVKAIEIETKNLVASTLVESSRSTTSGLYISIQEKENIINNIILQGLFDISNESKKLLSNYMADYIL